MIVGRFFGMENKENTNVKAFNHTIERIKDFLDNKENLRKLAFSESVNTLCVDASWGNGKSFFADYLLKLQEDTDTEILKDYNVIKVNAFEYDIFSDPITHIVTNMYTQLNLRENKSVNRAIKFLRKNIRISLYGISVGFQENEDSLDEYCNFQTLKDCFKTTFSKFKNSVVIFDELDRCKPSYSLSLLEVVKHFFNIDLNISFIFLCDKDQLSHIVKGMYGESYNSYLYLDRFFHHTVRLEWDDSAKRKFIESIFRQGSSKEAFIQHFLSNEWIENLCITCRDILHFYNLCNETIHFKNESFSAFTTPSLFIARFLLLINKRYGIYQISGLASFIYLVTSNLSSYKEAIRTTELHSHTYNGVYEINAPLIEYFYKTYSNYSNKKM